MRGSFGNNALRGPVTQQYILGELCYLLDALEPMPGALSGAAAILRRQAEACSLSMLGSLLFE